jgi:hypothetical protein
MTAQGYSIREPSSLGSITNTIQPGVPERRLFLARRKMNLATLIQVATFLLWAAIGFVLGRNAGEHIAMRRVNEDYLRLERHDIPTRFAWADWRWIQLSILSLGGALVIFGWHRNVSRSIGVSLVTFVVSYLWTRTRPPALIARLRMQIEYDGTASIRLLRVQQIVMLVLGVLMLALRSPYKYWVIGVGLIFALIGSLIDTFVIGPAQLRRIQRMNKRLDE